MFCVHVVHCEIVILNVTQGRRHVFCDAQALNQSYPWIDLVVMLVLDGTFSWGRLTKASWLCFLWTRVALAVEKRDASSVEQLELGRPAFLRPSQKLRLDITQRATLVTN